MLKTEDFSKQFKEAVQRPVDKTLIKERVWKPGQKLKYISGSTAIDLLNALTYEWSWIIKKEFVQESVPFRRRDWAPDKPSVPQAPVAHVLGALTVYIRDENGNRIPITKEAYGNKPIVGGQDDQKDIFKAAATDALKKACSMFGIGAELYRDEPEQIFWENNLMYSIWDNKDLHNKYSEEFKYLDELKTQLNATNANINDTLSNFIQNKKDIRMLTEEEFLQFIDFLKKTIWPGPKNPNEEVER